MARYTKSNGWQGYCIRDEKRKLYLTGVSRNGYKWCQDYTYARWYTEKTADRHLLQLNGKEN